jgi:signal transduction histidine kinase
MLGDFLDAIPANAAILDRKGVVIAVNAAWRAFSCANGGQREGYVGSDYLAVTGAGHDPDAEMVAGGLVAVLRGGLSNFQHDYPCHSTRTQRWFRCLISPLHENGQVSGATILHIDISEQKQAEARALAASRAKSEFLANMSHELRTPLNAVIGFSEIMMMEVFGPLGDDHYRSYVEDIHTAGRHLLSLINEVLDLSKIEAGRYVLREEQVCLPEIIAQSLHLVEDRAQKAGIALSITIADDLPVLVADARLLRQILLNLLSNAVKFTPAGGSIAVAARRTATGSLELSVADTGIGIAADDIDRVLEPFGQVESDLSSRYSDESTGLGLPLARSFIELHQGTFIIRSQPGRGTFVAAHFPPQRLRPQPC